MFLTFTPNPCLERTLRLDPFPLGETRRVAAGETFVSAGGKGINAARVAARFGAEVLATGPVGRLQSAELSELAQREGIASDFVAVDADTRCCLNFLHGDGEKTEIIESGTAFSDAEGARLLEKWLQHLPRARLAAIGGAYAPGNPASPGHAAQLCELAGKMGVPLIFDGRGEELQR
ncbi:MAG TPA: PfkB family carbohydrate kinase, partial [Abditibacterium sp.]